MPSVLILEDDVHIARLLKFHFTKQGWTARSALTAQDAQAMIEEHPPDLIVLDLMLPKMDGLSYLKQLKRRPDTEDIPVMILSAKGEEVDRVVGLELGADDYVVKPFSVREFMLRAQNVISRRRKADSPAGQQTPHFEKLKCGCVEVDLAAYRVRVAGRSIHLTNMEFRLLVALMNRSDRVLTREHLLQEVWDIHSNITTRTIDTHIKRLRQKLGDCAACIETVRGVGYRFVMV